MSTPIESRNISYLNTYFGAAADNIRMLSTNQISPDYSINQLLFAGYNTRNAPINTFSLSQVLGKTFGMYTTTSRNVLHGSSRFYGPNGTFIAYYGIGSTNAGTSGILNPSNIDFPINVVIFIVDGDYEDIIVEFYINGSWSTRTMTSSYQSWREELTGIRIIGNFPVSTVNLVLTSFPSLGGEDGEGAHEMELEFEETIASSEESSDFGGGKFLK